jgi:hypothetical protein
MRRIALLFAVAAFLAAPASASATTRSTPPDLAKVRCLVKQLGEALGGHTVHPCSGLASRVSSRRRSRRSAQPPIVPKDVGASITCLANFAAYAVSYTVEHGEPPRLMGPFFPACGIG